MSQTLYGLLVGINDYPEPIPKLTGCVNDVNAIASFLRSRIASKNLDLQLLTLTNEAATYDGIIAAFRQHLGQARQNDLVFFSFSGHGSQEKAPSELLVTQRDPLNETLVCWDSRLERGRDLADKELAKLIGEVAKNSPQITVLLDCCHSGSGTREMNTRYVEPDRRPRPIDSYLFTLADVQQPSQLSQQRDLEDNTSISSVFRGRHVLLAACHASETAKEYNAKARGAFSYFLLETLQQANTALTYRDAFKRTNALIRAQVPRQSPQLEATHEEDLELYFLSRDRQVTMPYFTVSHHPELGWIMDGGAVHGLSQTLATNEEERTQLAIFPFETPAKGLSQLDQAVGVIEVIEVLPQASRVAFVEVEEPPARSQVFKAVVTRSPLVRLGVFLEGDEAGLALIRQALSATAPYQRPSLYVKESDSVKEASFRVVAQAGAYEITALTSLHPLAEPLLGFVGAIATQVVTRLEHMARWTTLVRLSAPQTTQIPSDAVQMQLYQSEKAIESPQIELRYEKKGERWHQPQFRLKLTNYWEKPLYCVVLDLTERYAISPVFFEAGGVWVQPGEAVWANDGKPLYASVPKALWQQGVTEYQDIYKLIFSTADFDGRLLSQPNLDAPPTRAAVDVSQLRPSVLNRLMARLQTRDVSTGPEEDEFYDDWNTSQISVVTIRPIG